MIEDRLERHHHGQRAYFDTADQPTMLPEESAYSRRHFEMLVQTAGLTRGCRVLEVGAGMGRFTRMFVEAGYDVVASDISRGQIDALKKVLPGVETVVASASELPAPDRPFDAIVGFFALHHVPDLPEAFARFASMLKPGGRVAFCEPNAFYLPFYLQVLLTPRMRMSVEKGLLDMRRGVLAPAMMSAALRDIAFTHYGYFPPVLHNHTLGRRAEQALEALPLPGVVKAFQIATGHRGRA